MSTKATKKCHALLTLFAKMFNLEKGARAYSRGYSKLTNKTFLAIGRHYPFILKRAYSALRLVPLATIIFHNMIIKGIPHHAHRLLRLK